MYIIEYMLDSSCPKCIDNCNQFLRLCHKASLKNEIIVYCSNRDINLIQAKLKTSKNVSIIYDDSVYPYEEDGSFNVSIIDSLDNPVAQFYFVDNNVIL